MGFYVGVLDLCGFGFCAQDAGCFTRPGDKYFGNHQRRFFGICAFCFQSVYAIDTAADRRARFESVVARPGFDISSAGFVYGLCRFFGGLCFCRCRVD